MSTAAAAAATASLPPSEEEDAAENVGLLGNNSSGKAQSTTAKDAKKLPLDQRMALAKTGPTLIFDGICNLCNGSMTWFQDRVRPDSPVWYMWAQHPDTHALLAELGISRNDIMRSWAYLEDGIVYRGSAAWLRALRNLTSPWCHLSRFDVMPEFVRESVYNTVAANRYNALGHSDACQRPNAAMRERFLHSTAVKGQKSDASIPPRVKRRLLIVGCGPAGLFVAKKMASDANFEVVVVEPKDFFEFTPGILRGMCHPEAMKDLVFELEPVLCDDLGVGFVQGAVTELGSNMATVKRIRGGVMRKGRDYDSGASSSTKSTGEAGAEGDDFLVFPGGNEDSETLSINFDFCVVAAGSQYTTSRLWKVPVPATASDADGDAAEATLQEEKKKDEDKSYNSYTMSGRVAELSAEHSKLEGLNLKSSMNGLGGGRVSIFGAGLVGVELASEIRHYFPHIDRVTLFDPQPTVLPPLPESAQKYATEWFQNNNVELKLGGDFNDESVKDAELNSDVCYKCVGVAIKADFLPDMVRDKRGQVVTNKAMQILIDHDTNDEGNESGGKENSNLDPEEVEMMGTDRAAIYGSGRIFAIGDCISVKGADKPYVKDTYPAEAMAEVVVANLRKAKTIQCMRTCPGVLRELGTLQTMTLCSLGPNDGIFAINDRMVSWGRPSTLVKGTVQYTKMSDSRNEFLGRSFWSLVPHW